MANDRDYRPLYPGIGKAVAERTYLRKKENGEWETWGEVADRVALGNSLLCKDEKEQEEEFEILRNHIANGVCLMSGRHLQHGDKDQPNKTMELHCNCATSATSFGTFLLLLNGAGVGRSFDDHMMLVNWDNAPNLRCVLNSNHPDFDWSAHESVRDAEHKYGHGKDTLWFKVPDSREGWAKAVEIWENAAFEKIHKDKLFVVDFSDVRPSGAPIGGMQGRPASGPVAFMNALNKCASIKGAGLPRWKQAMFIDHFLGECVVVGGSRRSARMSTKYWKDPDILDFIKIKRPLEYQDMDVDEVFDYRKNALHQPMGFLWSANNSVMVDKEFWDLVSIKKRQDGYNSLEAKKARHIFFEIMRYSYGDGTGEPGLINVDQLKSNNDGLKEITDGNYFQSNRYTVEDDTQLLLKRLAKRAMSSKYKMIVNPCLTTETLVYTADGRTAVSIGKLAQEGKDVPVFCLDDDGEVTVRTMRNPRVTGYDQKILKITLDNGRSLRVTKNHKFLLRGKDEHVRADALQPGDSLFVVNRYEPDGSSESRGHQYAGIGYSGVVDWEHCLIAAYHYNVEGKLEGKHVHHLNENKADNRPNNLEIRISTEHLSEHSNEDDNPNYSGYTHDQILEFATLATKENGRRLSSNEWQALAKEFGYPQSFSKWRNSHFNGIVGLLAQAAHNANLDPVMKRTDLDPRVLRSYQEMVSQGYDAEILDGLVVLNKNCEYCNAPMQISAYRPETGVCSPSCRAKMRDNIDTSHMQSQDVQKKALANRQKVLEERKEKTRRKQIEIYNDVKFHIHREPNIKEFRSACKDKGVSSEVGRPTSPWTKWTELKQAASDHNHKVVSIEEDGYEDVYNGTVDEFHNFFVGGFEETTRNGRPKSVWVNNTQCGEIALLGLSGFCVIADVVPYHAGTIEEAEDAFRATTRAMIRVNTMDSIYKKEVDRTNRIGIGMTGIHEFAYDKFGYTFYDLIDEEKSKDFWMTISRFSRACYDESVSYSAKLGRVTPHTITTQKPSGSIAKLFGLTEGCHLPAKKFYLRWVQFRKGDPMIREYEMRGYPVKSLRSYNETIIVGFPTKPVISEIIPEDKIVTADEVNFELQYKWLQLLEKYWLRGCDENGEYPDYDYSNQLSYTAKYNPNQISFGEFVDVIKQNQPLIKCCSVMPTTDDSAYEYLPEEPITKIEFEKVANKIQEILDEDIGIEHIACENDICPVTFNEGNKSELGTAAA